MLLLLLPEEARGRGPGAPRGSRDDDDDDDEVSRGTHHGEDHDDMRDDVDAFRDARAPGVCLWVVFG